MDRITIFVIGLAFIITLRKILLENLDASGSVFRFKPKDTVVYKKAKEKRDKAEKESETSSSNEENSGS